MAYGFEARNANGDILLSTEDDNQFFFIDNYTTGGVTYYGSGNATLASGEDEIAFSDIAATSQSNTYIDLSNDLFFVNIPSARITNASISGYTNGGFVGTNPGRDGIVFQGVSAGTIPWVKPRSMNNFSGAETGYGINVYNSGGKEGGQSALKWSSNAQGHLDIVAVGRWNTAGLDPDTGAEGNLYLDIPLDNLNTYTHYVLIQNTLHGGGSALWHRAPCYEFRYADSQPVIRLHATYAVGGSAIAQSSWVALATAGVPSAVIPSGFYMIVRERP